MVLAVSEVAYRLMKADSVRGPMTIELVIPELRRRGLFRTEYESTTLRRNLGLTPPRSRYAA